MRGGWTVRQLDRQIGTQFYERTALSRNKATMLRARQASRATRSRRRGGQGPVRARVPRPQGRVLRVRPRRRAHPAPRAFLLELGGDFAFVGRQRRLRIGDEWYRVDLLFFHRRLRCLVVIDLKLGKFTHADAGQMHLYLNYAREHWTQPGENPPVGLILCAEKDAAVAHYALEGLPNKVLAREYRLALPDEKLLAAEIARHQRLEAHSHSETRRTRRP